VRLFTLWLAGLATCQLPRRRPVVVVHDALLVRGRQGRQPPERDASWERVTTKGGVNSERDYTEGGLGVCVWGGGLCACVHFPRILRVVVAAAVADDWVLGRSRLVVLRTTAEEGTKASLSRFSCLYLTSLLSRSHLSLGSRVYARPPPYPLSILLPLPP
jgi:hypothetical protein